MKRNQMRLQRQVSKIKLAEVSSLLNKCFKSDDRKFERFLMKYGFVKAEFNKLFKDVFDARTTPCHPYGWHKTPKVIKIPDENTLRSILTKEISKS